MTHFLMVILVKPFVQRASQKGHRNAFAGKKTYSLKDVCFAYATFISHNHVFLEPKRKQFWKLKEWLMCLGCGGPRLVLQLQLKCSLK